ncbi:MAG: hypothetical protein AAF456_05350 [Planctomycetota bacterium]
MKSKKEIEISHQIDSVCDAFERAWLEEDCPQIAKFCEDIPDAFRTKLIVELVELDVAYRKKRKIPLDLNGYAIEFPEALADLRPLLLELMAESGASAVASPGSNETDDD